MRKSGFTFHSGNSARLSSKILNSLFCKSLSYLLRFLLKKSYARTSSQSESDDRLLIA